MTLYYVYGNSVMALGYVKPYVTGDKLHHFLYF